MSDPLDEVRAFHKAARRLVRAEDLDDDGRGVALVRLARRALEAALPEMAYAAVFSECLDFLVLTDPAAQLESPYGSPVERALRGLVAEGYRACPTCWRALPGDETFRRWARMRRARIEQLERLEDAL